MEESTVTATKKTTPNQVYMFNKFFLELLRTVKYVAPQYAVSVKTNYHSIDKHTDKYIESFLELNADVLKDIDDQNVSEKLDKVQVMDGFFLEDVVLQSDIILFRRSIMEKLRDSDQLINLVQQETMFIRRKAISMSIMAHIHAMSKDNKLEEDPALFGNVLTEMFRGEQGLPPSGPIGDVVISSLIGELASICMEEPAVVTTEEPTTKTTDNDADGLDDILKNCSLGKLVKDITADIDVSRVQGFKDATEMLSDTNLMKEIYGKVSGAINDQLSSGQLDQTNLLGECMNLVQAFGMQGFPGIPTTPTPSTRKPSGRVNTKRARH